MNEPLTLAPGYLEKLDKLASAARLTPAALVQQWIDAKAEPTTKDEVAALIAKERRVNAAQYDGRGMLIR